MTNARQRFLVALCALFLVAAAEGAQWARTYVHDGVSVGTAVQATADGGYVVAGWTSSPVSDGANAFVLRLDAAGAVVWQKKYGKYGSSTYAETIELAPDGGYVVAGFSLSAGDESVMRLSWLLKLDAAGEEVWQKTYPGGGIAKSLVATADGGYILAGRQDIGSRPQAWVLKLDAAGEVAWSRLVDGGNAYSIRPTADGGYVVAGYAVIGSGDAWVIKLDRVGEVVWQKTYGGTNTDYANAVLQTGDGGYVVAGGTGSFAARMGDAWVLRLDASGNVVWQRTYGGALGDWVASIQLAADGGYVVAGQWGDSPEHGGDVWLAKLDAGGNFVWQRIYGRGGGDHARSMQATRDGGYVIAGVEGAAGPYTGDVWVLKVDGAGAITGCGVMGTSDATWDKSYAAVREGAGTGAANPVTAVPGEISARDFAGAPVEQCFDPYPASRLTAIEYHHRDFDHYFVTALDAEIAALDAGQFSGWARTGLSFRVYGLDPAVARVCRFWSGQTFVPKSSHFYTPFDWECAIVKGNPDWMFEAEVFGMQPPLLLGGCREGTIPLYRLYNDGQSGAPNHRYTTSVVVREQMLAQGWVPEGYGSVGVIGCVPLP